MESHGYDLEVITKAHPDMYCTVCTKLMREPVQFECTHGICKPCYQKIVVTANKQCTLPLCPHCKKTIDDKEVNSNDMLHRMILTVRVKCSNSMYGCYWIGKIGDLRDHYEDCRHIIPSYNRRTGKSKTRDEVSEESLTQCPYFPYGCTSDKLTEKALRKHLANNAKYHLTICTEFVNQTPTNTELESHQKYMADTVDNIFSSLDSVNKVIATFEQQKSNNMETIKSLVMEPMEPFRELFDHVRQPDKFMPRVEIFCQSVNEYIKKFDTKAFLDLSYPCLSDDMYSANDFQCRKISVADVFRFDQERLHDNYDKLAKKLKALKKIHYTCFVIAKDAVRTVERRGGDADVLFTQQKKDEEEAYPQSCPLNLVPEPRGYRGYRGMEESRYRVASRVTERNRDGSESEENNIEEEEKSGVAYMQRCFDKKIDSIIQIMDDALAGIKDAYKEKLLDFIGDKSKGHSYADYHMWKIETKKLQENDKTVTLYKSAIDKGDAGNVFKIWSPDDDKENNEGNENDEDKENNNNINNKNNANINNNGSKHVAQENNKYMVKYQVKIPKEEISARIFCFSQNELDRVAPCNVTVSKVLAETCFTTYNISAEFSIDLLKSRGCITDVMYFNTVVI